MTWPLNTTLLCTFGKESTCNAGNPGSIPGLGRYPGEGLGYPLQYSDLENSMDYSPWGHKELDTTATFTFTFSLTDWGTHTLAHHHCAVLPLYIFLMWNSSSRMMGNGDMEGLPWRLSDKESACNAGDLDLIPGLGKSPGEGKGYPLQYSDLENSMDYRAWGYNANTTEWLSLH